MSGILAEPRTPIDRPNARIPGTLPAMTSKDLQDVLYNWSAWVKSQRDAFDAQNSPAAANAAPGGAALKVSPGTNVPSSAPQEIGRAHV